MNKNGRSMSKTLFSKTAMALASVISMSALGQRDFSNVEVIPRHVQGGYYYLQGAGGNIGLSVGDDGIVMIDDQFAPLTDKILAAIESISDGEFRFLINTHVHGDHTGGNENLGKMGIQILARDKVRVRLLEQLADKAALPVVTFQDRITVHLNGEDAQVIPVPPAHTDGDSIIYFTGSDVIHAGDIFRTVGYHYMDLENGGSLQGSLDALAILIGMSGPDTLIVPGHGKVSTREDVIEFRDIILDTSNQVRAMINQGMNYEQIAAANPTAAYDAKWGDPERFLQGVYKELGGRD